MPRLTKVVSLHTFVFLIFACISAASPNSPKTSSDSVLHQIAQDTIQSPSKSPSPSASASASTSPSPSKLSSPSKSPSPNPTPSPQQWRIGRLFSIASGANMTRIMKHDSEFVSASAKVQSYIEYVEASTLSFLKQKLPIPARQPLKPCNFVEIGYSNSMIAFFENRLLPTPDVSCLTQFEGPHAFLGEQPSFTIGGIFEAVLARGNRLYAKRMQITLEILGTGNWTSPDVNLQFPYKISRQKCEISHAYGQRIFDKWYLVSSITNINRVVSVPLFKRQYLQEYMHVDKDGSLGAPMKYSTRRRPLEHEVQEHIWINSTTTSLASNRDRTRPNGYNGIYAADNPALISALRKSETGAQQVNDALAPSSLSILVLPLALNLIPLAALTHVGSRSLLLYTLLSDVLTVVPLAIKGIELTVIGRKRDRAIVSRITNDISGARSESSAMILWVAECKTEGGVLTYGIVFIVLSIVFMAIGIALEVVARSHLRRKMLMEEYNRLENEPFIDPPPPERIWGSQIDGNQW